MTIEQAIAEAKATGNWSVVKHEPTSVNVGFYNYTDERDDETQFDLWGDDHEKELTDLWNELGEELESKLNEVLYVEALGYVES